MTSIGILPRVSLAPGGGSWRPKRRRVLEGPTGRLLDLRRADLLVDGKGPPHRRIRVCVPDTLLQTGGAEWFSAQLAGRANPEMFEFVFVCYRREQRGVGDHIESAGHRIVSAVELYGSGFTFQSWIKEGLRWMLKAAAPDIILFTSQYLYRQALASGPLEHPTVVRISNWDGAETAAIDFSGVERIVACSEEQFRSLAAAQPGRTVFVRTGVDADRFRPATLSERVEARKTLGLPESGGVILYCGRLGDPLKRLDRLQDIVRRMARQRPGVTFLVAGYFESHRNAGEAEFRRFCEENRIVWHANLRPWEMVACYQAADLLVSVSDSGEGLSNTVLQALASGVVPVVTRASGMTELVQDGRSGFVFGDDQPETMVATLLRALDLPARELARLRRNGIRIVRGSFDLRDCVDDYERVLYGVYRDSPARVPVTDAVFGVGGAEWLAALLCLGVDPSKVRMELVLNQDTSALAQWMREKGVPVHCPPAGVNYDQWSRTWLPAFFQATRPHVVMPCTVTSWPMSRGKHRFLGISQNASDRNVLTDEQYGWVDHLICVSEDVRLALARSYWYKMTVLHNSIDVAMFRRDTAARDTVRARLGMPSGAKVVLWVGRLSEPRKRLDVLREVIELAGPAGLHFLVLGYFKAGSSLEDPWRQFVAQHPEVTWIPGIRNWETPEYYSAADFYLSTSGYADSDFEGLSLAAVQALAAGLPIVTTRSGGQREVVADGVNGFITATGDARALAGRLGDLAEMPAPELELMARGNVAKACAQFDIRGYARRYETLVLALKNTVDAALCCPQSPTVQELEFVDQSALSPDRRRAASFYVHHLSALLIDRARSGPDGKAASPEFSACLKDLKALGLGFSAELEGECRALWDSARAAKGGVVAIGVAEDWRLYVMARAARKRMIVSPALPRWLTHESTRRRRGELVDEGPRGNSLGEIGEWWLRVGLSDRVGTAKTGVKRVGMLYLGDRLSFEEYGTGFGAAGRYVEPGGLLVVAGCARPLDEPGQAAKQLGAPVAALLDYLRDGFPLWRRPRQVGNHIFMEKRAS